VTTITIRAFEGLDVEDWDIEDRDSIEKFLGRALRTYTLTPWWFPYDYHLSGNFRSSLVHDTALAYRAKWAKKTQA